MPLDQTAWFCARTRHNYERVAAERLRRIGGVDVFHPRFRARRLVRDKVVRVTESLFPDYLLVRFPFPKLLDQVRYSYGVKDVIYFGNSWPTVADGLVAELQESFGEDCGQTGDELAIGGQVILSAGACAGRTATMQVVMPARKRLQVLFDILGRGVRLELPFDQVVPVKCPGLIGARVAGRPFRRRSRNRDGVPRVT